MTTKLGFHVKNLQHLKLRVRNRISSSKFNFVYKTKHFYYRKKTNYPFLSGDGFASICDLYIKSLPLTTQERVKLKKANSIFVVSHLLEALIADYSDDFSSSYILAGNSDFEFTRNISFPDQLKTIFLQNSFISDSKRVFTLPIGVENISYARNGIPSLLKYKNNWNSRKYTLMVGPFGNSHPDRDGLYESYENFSSPKVLLQNMRMSPRKFTNRMNDSKFVLCPRGNGIDTHRAWEALYRGCIPILKIDEWSRSLAWLKLPFLLVDDLGASTVFRAIENNDIEMFNPDRQDWLWLDRWQTMLSKN